uniref:procollagen-proline 4-dioxygenase n=1 Tax=Stomoxys calcitrans TaxID=35570 RepID=A0A1I8PNK1_STOCA
MVQCQEVEEKSFSTSIVGMEQLLITEQVMVETLDKYADELQAKVNSLKRLVSELRTENQKGVQNLESYLYNPLNGFSLIRRMHYDWNNIEKYLTLPTGEFFIDTLREYQVKMPTETDLKEASQAIARLQQTYDLEVEDMSRGVLFGKQYDAKLIPIDRYFIGKHFFDKADYYRAALWMRSAMKAYESSNYMQVLDFGQETILSLYAEILLHQNRPQQARVAIEKACHLRPNDADMYSKPLASKYQLGCRGEFQSKLSKLHCVYNTTTSPFLILAPLKMEILSVDPYMVIYYDVMSDVEIQELKTLAKPNLKRAKVGRAAKSRVVERRTSKSSWISDNKSNTTLRINQRIRDMTGFDIEGSEALQVVNYGLGGHYDTHYDFFNVSDNADVIRLQGNRISTVLFYLTDVEQGGATVFPDLETAVFPQKGSAVVWYNLNNELRGDMKTLHAACPVIYGSKWVCNKWIRANAQVFKRPCYI